MTLYDPDQKRQQAQTNFLMRIIATAAVWSIVVVMALRLRHPMITFTMAAIGVGVTILIWVQPSQNK